MQDGGLDMPTISVTFYHFLQHNTEKEKLQSSDSVGLHDQLEIKKDSDIAALYKQKSQRTGICRYQVTLLSTTY